MPIQAQFRFSQGAPPPPPPKKKILRMPLLMEERRHTQECPPISVKETVSRDFLYLFYLVKNSTRAFLKQAKKHNFSISKIYRVHVFPEKRLSKYMYSRYNPVCLRNQRQWGRVPGVVGNFFFFTSMRVRLSSNMPEWLTNFPNFSGNFCRILRLKYGGFVVIFF